MSNDGFKTVITIQGQTIKLKNNQRSIKYFPANYCPLTLNISSNGAYFEITMRSISTLTEAGNVNNQRAGIHHTLLSTSIENIINITPATTAQLGTIKCPF